MLPSGAIRSRSSRSFDVRLRTVAGAALLAGAAGTLVPGTHADHAAPVPDSTAGAAYAGAIPASAFGTFAVTGFQIANSAQVPVTNSDGSSNPTCVNPDANIMSVQLTGKSGTMTEGCTFRATINNNRQFTLVSSAITPDLYIVTTVNKVNGGGE